MRSVHGTFATLLLMVPVLSIPALAIFGIPQFAPVVASPLDEGPRQDRERRVGQSARQPGDNFEELEEAPPFGDSLHREETSPGRLGDSVPVTRPGRKLADPNAFPNIDPREQPRTQKPPKSPWKDEAVPEDRQPPDFDDGPRRTPDRSRPEEHNNPFNSKPPGLYDSPERSRENPGAPEQRPYQRRRNPQPQPGDHPRNDVLDSEPLTWKTAVQRLNDMEIRNFRLQPGLRENHFAFSCMYTPADSPRVSYKFEAEADEPLKAVEKVLEQILEWQQRR